MTLCIKRSCVLIDTSNETKQLLLMEEKKELRDEKSQLKDEENQLLEEKIQLMDEKIQLMELLMQEMQAPAAKKGRVGMLHCYFAH